MAGVNKAIIIGRLGNDPEIRYMPNGNAVASLSVATSEKWKDKQTGEQKEATEWHRVSIFGKPAEIAGQYLRKGSNVYLEGKIRTRKWQGQDGQDKYTTEIVIDVGGTMQMLDSASGSAPQPQEQQPQQPRQPAQRPQQPVARPSNPPADYDDGLDIPF